MARALVAALGSAGHTVVQPSGLRSFLPAPDMDRQAQLHIEAEREIDRITAAWTKAGPPDVWFTYHNHYKAPDLLGPAIARRFALPYVVAEASHAPKRAATWTSWHAASEAAIRAADLHLCFTARDRDGLSDLLKPECAAVDLAPFLDLDDFPPVRDTRESGPPRLVTLAMMRPGDKLASYSLLAEALERLGDMPWHLDIIGSGPAKDDVAARFSGLPAARLTWHGTLEQAAAWQQISRADLFVWPGFGEAFGLAYLEAQAAGVPVLAFDTAGVSAVVRHGTTGVLVAEISAQAYADALRAMLSDRDTLAWMGVAARQFVLEERTLAQASVVLDTALRGSLERKSRSYG